MSRPGLSYEPPLFAWNVGSIVQEIAARCGIPYDRIETEVLVDGRLDSLLLQRT